MGSAFYLPVSAVLSIVVIFDLINTVKKNNKLGEARFRLYNVQNASSYASVILLIAAIGVNLYVNRMIKDQAMLYIAYWMFLLLARSVLYILKAGGVYESGIWFSGRFYSWEAIGAYYCDKDTGRVGLAVTKSLLGCRYKSKLRLQAQKMQIASINELLSERLNKEQVT